MTTKLKFSCIIVSDDPEIEADMKKEWKGEGIAKRMAMRTAKALSVSRGFKMDLITE